MSVDTQITSDPSRGFRPLNIPSGNFLAENGSFLGLLDGDVFRLGLHITPSHANVGNICHGGMLMTIAETQLVMGAMARLDDFRPLMTVNTSNDFVRPGIMDGWVTGETVVIRATRNLVFAECLLYVDGELALRASGVLRRTDFPAYDREKLFLEDAPQPLLQQGDVNPPEGFAPANIPGEFLVRNGPLHASLENNNLCLGLRIEDRHCDGSGFCHAGNMMMFADVQLALGSMFKSDEFNFMPTMHMSADFVAPVRPGAWLSGETEHIRSTRNMVFSTCILSVDSEPVVRASAINKRTSKSFDVVTHDSIFDISD